MNHPATMSEVANRIFPKENQRGFDHDVGIRSQARRGV